MTGHCMIAEPMGDIGQTYARQWKLFICISCLDEAKSVQYLLRDYPVLQRHRMQCIGWGHFHNLECLNEVSVNQHLQNIKDALAS